MRKPKNFNRVFLVDIGTADAPKIVPIAAGITSHGSNISESTEKYYYMDQRGTAETDLTGQDVSRSFSGHRMKGDEAQDYILDELLYDIDNREIVFYDYDESLTAGVNGWKGVATIRISDDGSGDTAARQNIAFSLAINGKPERGTVSKTESGYTWTPAT